MSHSKTARLPSVQLPGGPFLDEAALHDALAAAPSGVKNTVMHLHNIYKALAIVRPFHHKLNEEQLWRTRLVRCPDDWADIAGRFMADVDLHGLLAFDTESYRPTQGGRRRDRFSTPAPTRVLYAIASTTCGFTAVFDLEALNRGSPLGNDDAFSVLPPPFRRWIEDPAVLILGSNVAVDLQDPSLRATSLVDTRVLWRHFLAPSSDPAHNRGKLIKIYGIGNRDGLQVQALWAKGFAYKPAPEETFVRLFGSHPYRDANGNSKWPWFRNAAVFYQWWKTAAGGIRQEHMYYLFHDSTTPISLAVRLVLERVLQVGAVAVFPSGRSTADVFRSFFEDFAVTKPAPVLSAAVVAEDVDDDVEVLPPPSLPNIGLEYESEDPEVDSPAAAVSFPAPLWRQRDLSLMPYEANPSFGHHCTACGSSSHSFLWNNQEACPEYLSGDRHSRLTCLYELCKTPRGDHNTKVCSLLHHVCQVCWCRGHYESDRCSEWDLARWSNNRRFWEIAADYGLYTSARRTHWNLGFFAHRPYTPYPFPIDSYKQLAAMPFQQARALILDFSRGVWTPPPQSKRTATYAHLSPQSVEALKRRRRAPRSSPDSAAAPAARPPPRSLFSVTVPAPPGWSTSSAMDTASPRGPPPRVLPSFLDRVRTVRARQRALSDPPRTPPAVPVTTECVSAPPNLGRASAPHRPEPAAAAPASSTGPLPPDAQQAPDSASAGDARPACARRGRGDDDGGRLPSPEPGPSRYHNVLPAGYSSSDEDEEEALECFLRPWDRRF